jgi:DNA-binding GntR family transcriptional regulator
VGMLTDQMERYRHYRMIRTPPKVWARDLEREHRDLMDAALARDAARVSELLVAHLARTADFISALASVAAE